MSVDRLNDSVVEAAGIELRKLSDGDKVSSGVRFHPYHQSYHFPTAPTPSYGHLEAQPRPSKCATRPLTRPFPAIRVGDKRFLSALPSTPRNEGAGVEQYRVVAFSRSRTAEKESVSPGRPGKGVSRDGTPTRWRCSGNLFPLSSRKPFLRSKTPPHGRGLKASCYHCSEKYSPPAQS